MGAPKDPTKYDAWKKNIISNCKKVNDFRKGKTNLEIFGEEKSMGISKKISKGNKGHIPWNKDKPGCFTKSIIIKMTEASRGRKYPKDEYPNHGMRGKTQSEEWCKQQSIKMTGENNPRYGMTGEKSSNWLDGKSFEPYTFDFNKRFKESIRGRDNYTCQLCNLFEDDAVKLYNKILNIHHVDYIKTNSFPQNCVSLCHKCNSIVNFNRIHWTKFFQSLLKERYGYEYTEDQKIILDFMENK